MAPLALANAVVPEMMRQGWGRIVNVTTGLGTMINPGLPTYGPSKAALEALSAIMAKDLDGTGVTVNVLVPGGITNTPEVPANLAFGGPDMKTLFFTAHTSVYSMRVKVAGLPGHPFKKG
jgi:NAD(P)-dependent dehydrogenase (short-subunit alcohol dehydrogenase family)